VKAECDESERAVVGDSVMIEAHGWYLPKKNKKTGRLLKVPVQKNEAITIKLGGQQLMPGMERGIVGMCQGDKVRVYFPPSLGFDHPITQKRMSEAGVEKKIMPKGAALRFDIVAYDVHKLIVDPSLFEVLEVEVEHHKRQSCKAEDLPVHGDLVTMVHRGYYTTQANSESGLLHQFDQSSPAQPFSFVFGEMQVLPGIEIALKKLCAGSKVTVRMPPEEAFEHPSIKRKFKEWGEMPVPAWAPIRYTIQLQSVERGAGFEKMKREDAEREEQEAAERQAAAKKKGKKKKARKAAQAKEEL